MTAVGYRYPGREGGHLVVEGAISGRTVVWSGAYFQVDAKD